MKSKKLSFIESIMLVAGAGIGTGILTIPYAINKIGVFGTLFALFVAYFVSMALYLIIADLTLNSKNTLELLGILQEHLFYDKRKKVLSTVFFIILTLLLLETLIVYIMCASDVLVGLLGINPSIAKIAFYLFASLIIFFGIKGLGIGEKYSVALIGIIITVLIVLSLFNNKNSLNFTFGEPRLVFAVYGLFIFAFSAIFAVIQVCNNIENVKLVKKAIIGGLTINATLTLLFTFAVIIGSNNITEIGTIGLSDSFGLPLVSIMCSVFVLLAMLSSFWSSGLAFADVVGKQLKINKKYSWIISTLPTIIIALILPLSILDYIQIGAGALSIILVIVVLPAYKNVAKQYPNNLLTGSIGTKKVFIYVVGLFICLMALSSLVPIN